MFDEELNTICRPRELQFKHTDAMKTNPREKFSIQREMEKADLHIFFGFTEMDVAWFDNTARVSVEFKEDVLFVLDHLAKLSGSESMEISHNQENGFWFDRGFVRKGQLPQFTGWAKTFDVEPHDAVPIYVYGERPLEQRVRIWNGIVERLEHIHGSAGYTMKQGVGYVSIHWNGQRFNKHLEIHPHLLSFEVQQGIGKSRIAISIDDEKKLLNFIEMYARDDAVPHK